MGFRFNPLTGSFDLVNPTGTGDTTGPASSTDNAVVRFDGTTGKALQNSSVTIDDSGNISSSGDLSLTGGSGSDLLITQLGKVVLNITAGGNNYVVAGAGGTPSLDLYAGNVKGVSVPYDGTQVSLPNGVNLGNTTASTALVLDSSKNVISSSVTSTELGYVSGVTSALQTQLNNKISSDGSIAFTSNQSMGGHNLTNVATPSSATDAANKQYVLDQVAAAGTSAEWQASVITATILDPSTISGTPTAGDRYLINGTGVGGWSGKDNQIAQYVSGNKALVGSWTYTVASTGTYVSADDASTVLYYFGGSSWTTKSFEVTTASTGLTKVGNDIRTDSSLAGSALTFTTGVLSVNVDNSTLDISSNNLEVKAGGITNTQVSNSAAIAYSKLNLASSIVNADISGSAAIAYSKLNLTGSIVNADVASGAAIAVNKLAALTANKAVATDSSGFLVSSATTDTELGFVSGVTSAIQTQLNGKQATGNYITALTGDVTATGPGSVAATVAKIQGTTVSGTTGSTNVVFSASPTLTGTITAAAISASGAITTTLVTDSTSTATGSIITSGGAGFAKSIFVGGALNLNGSTSGTLKHQAAATTTNYTLTWPSAQGGSSTVLTNDGSGGLSWGTVATGANTTLSNLGTTSINADLIPSAINTRNLGSTSIPWSTLNTSGVTWRDSATASILGKALGGQTSPSGNTPLFAVLSQFVDDASSHDFAIYTPSSAVSSANPSGTLHLETGNRTAGTGNSGDIALQTGTSSGGTRGTVTINPELRLNGSTSGYVGLKASATPTSHTYTMPTAQGAANTVLSNDGSGILSWLTATGTGNNVLSASPTLTGTVSAAAISASSTITTTGGGNSIILTSAATAANAIAFQTAASNRWIMGMDGVAESGSDAGSGWQLRARTDAGGAIDNPIVITRAAGGAITATRPIVTTSTTDSTSTATGSIKTSGGIGVTKNITTGQMVLVQGYHFRSTTGNFTINDNTNYCVVDAGAQATLTVTMPANPQDGQELKVMFAGAITTLTVSPNSGQTIKNAPVTAATDSGFSWFYRSANTTWYRAY